MLPIFLLFLLLAAFIGRGAEVFAWAWLSGVTLAAMTALLWLRRWLNRDALRFAESRRELER
jgi:hypothetical protein